MIRVVKENKWARILSLPRSKDSPTKHYLVEASGPRGWIPQSDYVTLKKAIGVYKGLS